MLAHFTQLVLRRAWIDLKTEAAQNYIGVVWWVLEPLMYMVTFYVVFEVFMQRGGPGFVGFLLCGIVFFRWFDSATKSASTSIMVNGALIRQIYLPKLLFPLTAITSATIRFGFIFTLLMIFLSFYTAGPRWIWLVVPVLLCIQFLFIAGLGMVLSVFVPIYPDLRKIIDNGMLLLFYMSGVFFDTSRLAPEIQKWLNLNPMAVMIKQFRAVLLNAQTPDWVALGYVLLTALVLMTIGLGLLYYYDRKLPNYLN